MDMLVDVEKVGSFIRRITVRLPQERVATAFQKTWRKIAKSVTIPGFRPGKVPTHLLEKSHGAQIEQQTASDLIDDSVHKAIEQLDLHVVATPKVDAGRFKRDAEFSYTVEVQVRPDITLQKISGLEIVHSDAPPATPEQIDAMIAKTAHDTAPLVPVFERDTVELGDMVLIRYTSHLLEEKSDSSSPNDATVDTAVDENEEIFKGFAKRLVGEKVPGKLEITCHFPDDYSEPKLAGQPIVFHVEITEIKKREVPLIDDDFAKDIGEESLAALQQKVRDKLEKEIEQQNRANKQQAILTALVEANPFDVPPAMVHRQAESLIAQSQEQAQQILQQGGQLSREHRALLQSDRLDDAEKIVRSSLLVMEIAKSQNLTASDLELNAEIDRLVSDMGPYAERARIYYESPDNRETLGYELSQRKVVEHLLESANITAAPHKENT